MKVIYRLLPRRLWSSKAPSKHDLIGPPDSLSNIPPLRFRKAQDVAEEELQEVRRRVWQLNHSFWSTHNLQFELEKKKFISDHQQGDKNITSQELSSFYKDFLDRKYEENLQYSQDWLKLQVRLTFVSLKVCLKQLVNKLFKSKT